MKTLGIGSGKILDFRAESKRFADGDGGDRRVDYFAVLSAKSSARRAFSTSRPSPLSAEMGMISRLRKRRLNAARFSAASGRSILLATTIHGLSASVGS